MCLLLARFLTGEVRSGPIQCVLVGDLSESEWSTTGLTTPWISRRRNGRSAVPMCTWGFPTPNLGFQLGATACLGSGGCHQTPCPQQNSKAPDHALELLLLCWYHHQHATKMVWPLQGQEKRKPIQQEQFFYFFQEKEETMKFQKKREEGNANQGLNQSHENGYPFNFASKRFIDN